MDEPKMSKEQQEKPDRPEDQDQDGEAMEYEFDQEAEQIQGRLATDNLQPEEPEDADKAQDPEKKDD